MEAKPSNKKIQWYRKQREAAKKAKDPNSTDEETDSSTDEDDDAEGDTPQVEKDFFKTLSYVKSKDPRIYDKQNKFYQSDEDESSETGTAKPNAKEEKAMYLRDYERKIIVEKGGQYSEDESDDDGRDRDSDEERDRRAASPTYVQEQKQIQESFRSALHSDEDDELMLTKKNKSQTEKDQEEADYKQWLMGNTDNDDTTENKEMGALRQYWVDPNLDEGEKFLRNYILNKEYISKDDAKKDSSEEEEEEEEEEAGYSEEERILEEQENFERKYNFRYEEPDAEFIKRYPRTVAGSVRRRDTSRAEHRQQRRERKEEEKSKLQDELKRHKNVKKQEIMSKLEQLRAATGNAKVGFDPDDLDGDFDPEKHEQMMQNIFDNEYETQDDSGLKPDFADEFEREDDIGEWDGDDYGEDIGAEGGEEYWNEEEHQPHCDDPDFIMDADYDPSTSKATAGTSKKKNKTDKKKKAGFADVVKNERPVFDPDEKSFDDYMDEYYGLDYEDLIGDMPCRFKYRSVMPNDFGLSVEEVLAAKDKELNQWVSVKKTSQYRPKEEELHDLRLFRRRSQNVSLKQKIFPSLMETDKDDQGNEEDEQGKPEDLEVDKHEEKTPSDTAQIENTSKDGDQMVSASGGKKKRKRKRKTAEVPGTGEDNGMESAKPGGKEQVARQDKMGNVQSGVPSVSQKGSAIAVKRNPESSSLSSEESSSDEMTIQNKSLQRKGFDTSGNRKQESSSGETSSSEDELPMEDTSLQSSSKGFNATVKRTQECSSSSAESSSGEDDLQDKRLSSHIDPNTCVKMRTAKKQAGGRSSSSSEHETSSSIEDRTVQKGLHTDKDSDAHKKQSVAKIMKSQEVALSSKEKLGSELEQHKTLQHKDLGMDATNSANSVPVTSPPHQEGKPIATSGKKKRKRNKKKKHEDGVTEKSTAGSTPSGGIHSPLTMLKKSKHKKGPVWSTPDPGPTQRGKFDNAGWRGKPQGAKTLKTSGGAGRNPNSGGAAVRAKQVYQSGAKQGGPGSNKSGRQRKRKGGRNVDPISAISDARLKAYGVNPKKIKYQLEYQKQKLDKL